MNPPYEELGPGTPIDQGWFNRNVGGAVRNVTGGGTARVTQLGPDVQIYVTESDSLMKSFVAIITDNAKMNVYDPTTGTLISHEYRHRYAFSEASLEMRCIDSSGNTMDAEDCTPAQADSVEYATVAGGRSGTLTDGWAFNLSELTHPTAAHATTGEWWVWGRDVKESFYPLLYNGVAVGADYNNLHVQDVAVHMFEVMDKRGNLLTFFDAEGHHIGQC